MNFVMHICRNKECNNGWIDKDLTKVKTNPPAWKYCKECAAKLGIDFENQKPADYRTEEENLILKTKLEKAKEKIKSNIPNQGQKRKFLTR